MEIVQGLDAITVHLTQRHAAKAREFYTRVLGLKEVSWDESFGRGEWQVPGGATVVAHVMQPNEPGRPPGGPTGVMLTTRDVKASVEEVRRRGGLITDEPWKAPWGPQYATVADPDGNEWVFIQRG